MIIDIKTSKIKKTFYFSQRLTGDTIDFQCSTDTLRWELIRSSEVNSSRIKF